MHRKSKEKLRPGYVSKHFAEVSNGACYNRRSTSGEVLLLKSGELHSGEAGGGTAQQPANQLGASPQPFSCPKPFPLIHFHRLTKTWYGGGGQRGGWTRQPLQEKTWSSSPKVMRAFSPLQNQTHTILPRSLAVCHKSFWGPRGGGPPGIRLYTVESFLYRAVNTAARQRDTTKTRPLLPAAGSVSSPWDWGGGEWGGGGWVGFNPLNFLTIFFQCTKQYALNHDSKKHKWQFFWMLILKTKYLEPAPVSL